MPTIACDLLGAGIDNQPLREVAGLCAPTLRDAGPVFDRALSEAGAGAMTREAAITVYVEELSAEIVAGRMEPYSGAKLCGHWWHEFLKDKRVGLYFSYADAWEESPSARPEIEAAIRDHAKMVLTQDPALAI
ncbi:MAG: hypothetical protein ABJD11_16260 [Gemmatimonadota bacterium]